MSPKLRPKKTKLFFNRAGFAAVAGLLLCACGRTSDSPYLVYVTNEGSGDMTVIDPNRPQAIDTIPLGKRPRGIHASGGFIYVALSGSPAAPPGVDEDTLPPPDRSADGIGVVDLKQRKVIRKLFGGSDPEEFAIDRDGKRLYVANEDAAEVSVVDLAQGKILAALPTGEEPEGVSITPDGKFVWVTSEDAGTITVVDTAALKVAATIQVGRRPRTVAFLPDGSRAFVTNENDATVSVVDCARPQQLRTISLGQGMKPMGSALTKDGKKLFVSTGRGGKVFEIDTATETVIASIDVGLRPWGIALSPDEKLLFTANGPSNDVSVVEVASRRVLRKVPAGDRPWGVLVLPR